MTAQIQEKLVCGSIRHGFCTEPLADYLILAGASLDSRWSCTACWRGYLGTWELRDRRLYLIALSDELDFEGNESGSVSLATLFPDYPDRVFAHWYWGMLRIPLGKRIEYVHSGYATRHERDLLLGLEGGVLQSAALRYNSEDYLDRTQTLEVTEAVALLHTKCESPDGEE